MREILPNRSLPPLQLASGVRPSEAANCRPERKRSGSITEAASAVAEMTPIPGIVASRCDNSFERCQARSSFSIAVSLFSDFHSLAEFFTRPSVENRWKRNFSPLFNPRLRNLAYSSPRASTGNSVRTGYRGEAPVPDRSHDGVRLGDEPKGPGPDRGLSRRGTRAPCGRARTLAGCEEWLLKRTKSQRLGFSNDERPKP